MDGCNILSKHEGLLLVITISPGSCFLGWSSRSPGLRRKTTFPRAERIPAPHTLFSLQQLSKADSGCLALSGEKYLAGVHYALWKQSAAR